MLVARNKLPLLLIFKCELNESVARNRFSLCAMFCLMLLIVQKSRETATAYRNVPTVSFFTHSIVACLQLACLLLNSLYSCFFLSLLFAFRVCFVTWTLLLGSLFDAPSMYDGFRLYKLYHMCIVEYVICDIQTVLQAI